MNDPKVTVTGDVMCVETDKDTNMDKLCEIMSDWQDSMYQEQEEIASEFGVSHTTASAIQYLRTRSRWTQEKEDELISRDKTSNPISLGDVLTGEF